MSYVDFDAALADAVSLDGMPLLRVSEDEFVELSVRAMSQGRGMSVLTANTDILQRFARDPQFRECLGDYVAVADGMPLVWASRLLGVGLPERVSGSNLVHSLPVAALQAGLQILLLGGHEGVAAAAASRLVERTGAPGLVHAQGLANPVLFDDASLNTVRHKVASICPHLIMVSLGSPKTEQLIQEIRHSAPDALWIGVGAGLDFLAGRVRRAPVVVQRLGLEWAWRLCREPSRLTHRYLRVDLPYGLALIARSFCTGLLGRLRG